MSSEVQKYLWLEKKQSIIIFGEKSQTVSFIHYTSFSEAFIELSAFRDSDKINKPVIL